ncbi:Ig-like domain-containing protein [Mycobacterium sp. NPDC006124]|uniref:YncE family protein n=1 Tax=Mycobacterium sp. NPDC006124 TaxID=3156729 RepID=UPI0033B21F35
MSQANETSTSIASRARVGTHSSYVGRVGALALALGIGVAFGASPGMAWASPEAASDEAGAAPASAPESPGPQAVGAGGSSNAGKTRSPGTGTKDDDEHPRATVDVSGGAKATVNGQAATSTSDDPIDEAVDDPVTEPEKSAVDDDDSSDDASTDTEESPSNTGPIRRSKNDDIRRQATSSQAAPVTTVADTGTSVAPAAPTADAPTTTPTPASPTVAATPAMAMRVTSESENPTTATHYTGVSATFTQLVANALSPFVTPGPESPATPPVMFAILAFVRREFDSLANDVGLRSRARTATTQTIAPASTAAPVARAAAAAPAPQATNTVGSTLGFVVTGVGNVVGGILGFLGGVIGGVFNAPPTASPQITNIDGTSGVVTGQLNATDPNNDALTYQVTTQAGKGTATVDPAGTFSYTPTAPARATALTTPGPDYDTFTITITDARGARTAVTINDVPVTPANRAPVTSGPPSITGMTPAGVVTGNLNISDPDGDPLRYTFTSTPTKGILNLQSNGVFTYTPTPQSRVDAFNSVGPDSDSFTVVASDGRGGTKTVDVGNIPVLPSAGAYTATIDLQPNSMPRSEAISPDGTRVYVTHDNANLISVIDTASNTVTAVPVNDRPRAIVISPDGKRVYYTAYGHVSVFDTQSYSVVAQADVTPDGASNSLFAYDVALSADGTRGFVGAGTDDSTAMDGQLAVLDTATNQIVDRIPLHDATPIAVEASSDGRHVYVISQASAGPYEAHLLVVDTTTRQVQRTIVFRQQDGFVDDLTLSPDGKKLYVTGSSLLTVDTATNQVVGRTDTVNRKVTVSSDGKRIYYGESTRLSVFDVATGMLVDRIAIPTATPNQSSDAEVVLAPDGSRAYVTGYYENTVSVVSLTPR